MYLLQLTFYRVIFLQTTVWCSEHPRSLKSSTVQMSQPQITHALLYHRCFKLTCICHIPFFRNLKLRSPWCLTWCFILLWFLCRRDGRLREGDQILAIDGQPLDSNISHQQAISILQKARGLVELVVARSGPEDTPLTPSSPSPIDRSPSAVSDTSKAGSDMVVSCFLCGLQNRTQ